MKQWSKQNSKVFKFLMTLIIIGLITGIVLYLNLSKETKDIIIKTLININENLKITKQNNIIYHLFIISTFILLSLTLFLYPVTIFYIFYEILSFGFILAHYGNIFSIGGIIYAIIYFLINKALFLIVLSYISLISYRLIKKIINALLKKDNISVRNLYLNYFQKVILSCAIILVTDIFIYFFGNKILSLFHFLL